MSELFVDGAIGESYPVNIVRWTTQAAPYLDGSVFKKLATLESAPHPITLICLAALQRLLN